MADRYEDLGLIGVGGMGEVRRVRDRQLDRTLAMKVIRANLLDDPVAVARFLEEAQVGARLQHPGVPPVYEVGQRTDGRHFFTMKEVLGRPFAEAIREAHLDRAPSDAVLRRLIDVFADVCDAVGYAHSRGLIHRDLKPDNVMLGAFGEVLVIDWGLAKSVDQIGIGSIVGTPAYMSPEQARGERVDARTDVYALGALLYEVLSGRPPERTASGPGAPGDTVDFDALDEAWPDVTSTTAPEAVGRALPSDLVALCEQSMARDPAARAQNGAEVAAEVRLWLDGATRRAAGLRVVAEALEQGPAAVALRAQATLLRSEGARLLADVRPWEPEARKVEGWAREDEAVELEGRAALAELKAESLLRGALTHAPDLAEAHAALVDVHLTHHVEAESARDRRRAAAAESRLIEHLGALPPSHPAAVRAAAYLRGDGALSLLTDPEGATVDLYRYTVHARRLVPVFERTLGASPIRSASLAMGSYLCVLHHPDRADVRYPVSIGRGEHWDGVPPDAREPERIRMPYSRELDEDDVYVPAGWFRAGGDPDAGDSVPSTRLWCDGFVLKRFPVTNRAYLMFLNDRVAAGRETDALAAVPREEGGTAGALGAALYGRDDDGRFVLRADSQGDVWQPDWPVVMVHWGGALAYCQWLTEVTGEPWRLPGEFEREKAARGVDRRLYPFGDTADPSWACMNDSHAGRALPAAVDAFPVDASVYGVRGLGGNVRDWCADPFLRDLRPAQGSRILPPALDPELDLASTARRVYRGGSWVGTPRTMRSASRFGSVPGGRLAYLGLRPARYLAGRHEPDGRPG